MTARIEKDLTFTREKETKNTIRYQEVNDGQDVVIGPLYIQKHFLPIDIPANIRITITIDGKENTTSANGSGSVV